MRNWPVFNVLFDRLNMLKSKTGNHWLFLVKDPLTSLLPLWNLNPPPPPPPICNIWDESCETSRRPLPVRELRSDWLYWSHRILEIIVNLCPVFSLVFPLHMIIMWLKVLFPEEQGSESTLPTQQRKLSCELLSGPRHGVFYSAGNGTVTLQR